MSVHLLRVFVLVGALLSPPLIAAEAPPAPEAMSGAKRLVADELVQLIVHLESSGTSLSLNHIEGLLKDPQIAAAMELLGLKKRPIKVSQLVELMKAEETGEDDQAKAFTILASLMRFERLKAQDPAIEDAKLLKLMAAFELGKFPEGFEVVVDLPADVKAKIEAGRELVPGDLLRIAAASRYAAMLQLEREFYASEFPQPAGPEEREPEPAAGEAPLNILPRGIQIAPGKHKTPEQRKFQPAVVDRSPVFPMPPPDANGVVRLPPREDGAPAFSVDDVEFSAGVPVGPRKSLAMQTGVVKTSNGKQVFQPAATCQANVVHRTEGEPEAFCRFVVASAAHCLNWIRPGHAVAIQGLGVIDANRRHIYLAGGEGEDFAAMLVDAPCRSNVPVEKGIAKAEQISRNSAQDILVDTQMIGSPRSVAGKSNPTEDSSFLGFSIAGRGKIERGDSGGAARTRDGLYLGALSSKLVGGAFRDAIGYIATAPQWLIEGIETGFFEKPLPQQALVLHDSKGRTKAVHSGG